MKSRGFMILEFLIYFLLFSFMSVMVIHVVSISLHSVACYKKYFHIGRMHYALTLLERDIHHSQSDDTFTSDGNHFYIVGPSRTLHWYCTQHELHRVELTNPGNKTKSSNLVLSLVKSVSFAQQGTAITIHITDTYDQNLVRSIRIGL